jgi:hypothetical protein
MELFGRGPSPIRSGSIFGAGESIYTASLERQTDVPGERLERELAGLIPRVSIVQPIASS